MAAMSTDSPSMTNFRRTISLLLMLSFLWLTLFPYHYHLDHEDESRTGVEATSNHIVNLHDASDLTNPDHLPGSHTIEPDSDLLLKPAGAQLPLAVLVLSLLLLLPLPTGIQHPHGFKVKEKLPYLRWDTSPPLRAPPIR